MNHTSRGAWIHSAEYPEHEPSRVWRQISLHSACTYHPFSRCEGKTKSGEFLANKQNELRKDNTATYSSPSILGAR